MRLRVPVAQLIDRRLRFNEGLGSIPVKECCCFFSPVRVGSDGHMGSIPGGNRLFFPVEYQLNTSDIVRAGDENSNIKNEPP